MTKYFKICNAFDSYYYEEPLPYNFLLVIKYSSCAGASS